MLDISLFAWWSENLMGSCCREYGAFMLRTASDADPAATDHIHWPLGHFPRSSHRLAPLCSSDPLVLAPFSLPPRNGKPLVHAADNASSAEVVIIVCGGIGSPSTGATGVLDSALGTLMTEGAPSSNVSFHIAADSISRGQRSNGIFHSSQASR